MEPSKVSSARNLVTALRCCRVEGRGPVSDAMPGRVAPFSSRGCGVTGSEQMWFGRAGLRLAWASRVSARERSSAPWR